MNISIKALFLTVLSLLPTIVSAATIETRSLGWRAGQDISQELENLFGQDKIKPSDTLSFSANYVIQGNVSISLPIAVSLVGEYFGAGLTIENTEPQVQNGVFKLSENSRLLNMSFTYLDTLPVPPVSAGITSQGKSNTRGIVAYADNVTISNSVFRGNVGIHVDVSGTNFSIKDSHFDGGTTQLRWLAKNQNHRVENTLFENALGDGIKTVRGSEFGTDNASVNGSVFLNNRRDGIDTTGGFSNSSVSNSYFVKLFKGLDLKNIFDSQTTDLNKGGLNKDIIIRDSLFVDVNNGVAPITLDRGNSNGTRWISSANADQFLTQKISIQNCTFEATSGRETRAVLAVDVHSVNWNDLVFIGQVNEVRTLRNPAQSSAVDTSVTTNYNISGTVSSRQPARLAKPDSYYRSLAGPDTSMTFGNRTNLVVPAVMLLLD